MKKLELPPLYEFDICGFVLVFMMAFAFEACLHSRASSPANNRFPVCSFLSIVDTAANCQYAKPNYEGSTTAFDVQRPISNGNVSFLGIKVSSVKVEVLLDDTRVDINGVSLSYVSCIFFFLMTSNASQNAERC